MQKGQSKIFISYRREDSSGFTGRLYDHLLFYFNEDQIFKDVDNIPLGVDFRLAIEDSIKSSKILLAVIGQRYLSKRSNNKFPRLFDDKDFVNIELTSALKNNIRIIPILVNDAQMPNRALWPAHLQAIPFLNAYEIRHNKWKDDVKNLSKVIENILNEVPTQKAESDESKTTADENDINLDLELTLEEINTGIQKKVIYNYYSNCSICNGSGKVEKGPGKLKDCILCNGIGRIYSEGEVDIEVPAGIEEGMKLRIKEKGNQIKGKRDFGNLLVNIFQKDHSQFSRKGQDLIYILELTKRELSFGGNFKVPTISGNKIQFPIPANTEVGKVFRIKEKGLPFLDGSGKGNLLVGVKLKS